MCKRTSWLKNTKIVTLLKQLFGKICVQTIYLFIVLCYYLSSARVIECVLFIDCEIYIFKRCLVIILLVFCLHSYAFGHFSRAFIRGKPQMADFVSFGHNLLKYAIFSKDIYVEFIDPVFAKTSPKPWLKTSVYVKSVLTCFRENRVLKFGHCCYALFKARYTQGFSKDPALSHIK